jgi:transglutaminase-like putative cysteine protease
LPSEKTILSVRHVTSYRYENPVELGEHRMMMRPRDGHDQRLIGSELIIEPKPKRLRWLYDPFDNCVALASFEGETRLLRIENRFTVERTADEQPGGEIDPSAATYPFTYSPEELPDVARSVERLYTDPLGELDRWAHQFVVAGGTVPTSRLLMTMTYAIKESFTYERREESGVQSPRRTLDVRRGSCRDFAVLMMEAARALGIAARFVSGYIYVPRDEDGDDMRLGGGSTHAWVQVYLPGAGWVEFDPTNGLVGGRDLIRVAVARDPTHAAPLTGTYFGSVDDELGMEVSVRVTQQKGVADVEREGSPQLVKGI